MPMLNLKRKVTAEPEGSEDILAVVAALYNKG
jgi:hypothetical protein